MSIQTHTSTRTTRILRNKGHRYLYADDTIVAEEPLEILLAYESGLATEPFLLTMRSPGEDDDLIMGLLHGEGVIHNQSELQGIEYPSEHRAIAQLSISQPKAVANRSHKNNSACGVCGKSGIEALNLSDLEPLPKSAHFYDLKLGLLNEQMRKHQPLFKKTGGIHGAALFDNDGQIIISREDVGRHNAADKAIGAGLRGSWDLPTHGLLMSSRIGYEIVQKAAKAQISLIIAMGAASSLAVELADALNICLIGFLKEDRHNIYTHPNRVLKNTSTVV